jgi:hypothetical protein
MIKIEKNIPMPHNIRAGYSKYPFQNLEVGDSFLFPLKPGQSKSNYIARARAATHQASKLLKPNKFTARTTAEGLRIWRLK